MCKEKIIEDFRVKIISIIYFGLIDIVYICRNIIVFYEST